MPAVNFVLAAIFVLAGIFVFLFVLLLYVPKSTTMAGSPTHIFPWEA